MVALGYKRIFSPNVTGELRVGGNRLHLEFTADAVTGKLTPAAFGMNTGVINNFPDIRISGGPAFGGLSGYPQGRTDTTAQATYVLTG